MNKPKIRVIKKARIRSAEAEKRTTDEEAKEVNSTKAENNVESKVSDWVVDFKQRKEEESGAAFDELFMNREKGLNKA